MQDSIIRLCYQRRITNLSKDAWEAGVFQSTYAEYLLQSQFYNRDKQYSRFSELIRAVPAAVKLHFLVSAAVTPFLQQLEGKVPWIRDNAGVPFFSFRQYRFEIVESDSTQEGRHEIAFWFYSEPLRWHRETGHYLLLSANSSEATEDGVPTHLVEIQPGLSIFSIKPVS